MGDTSEKLEGQLRVERRLLLGKRDDRERKRERERERCGCVGWGRVGRG